MTAVVHARDAAHIDLAGSAIDSDFHRNRNIVLGLFVPGICESASGEHVAVGAAIGRGPPFPSDHFRSALDHIKSARIGQPAEAEFDGVDARSRRKFVRKTLDSEDVRHFPRST